MGVHSIVEQFVQYTTVCACEKTVVMVKQSRHLTSMKKELGACTNLLCKKEGKKRRSRREQRSARNNAKPRAFRHLKVRRRPNFKKPSQYPRPVPKRRFTHRFNLCCFFSSAADGLSMSLTMLDVDMGSAEKK